MSLIIFSVITFLSVRCVCKHSRHFSYNRVFRCWQCGGLHRPGPKLNPKIDLHNHQPTQKCWPVPGNLANRELTFKSCLSLIPNACASTRFVLLSYARVCSWDDKMVSSSRLQTRNCGSVTDLPVPPASRQQTHPLVYSIHTKQKHVCWGFLRENNDSLALL